MSDRWFWIAALVVVLAAFVFSGRRDRRKHAQALAEAAELNRSATQRYEAGEAFVAKAQGLLDNATQFNETSRRMHEIGLRLGSYNVLLLNTSSFLSICHRLEFVLTERKLDVERCTSTYAELEEDRDRLIRSYENSRSKAIAAADTPASTTAPDADAETATITATATTTVTAGEIADEIAVLDAVNATARELHRQVAAWYRGLEDVAWRRDRQQPAPYLWPARQACFSASSALGRIADRHGF